jgi:hypothetical protein
MKNFVLFWILFSPLFCSAQDSTETERIYYYFDSDLDFEVCFTPFLVRIVDSSSRIPIEGWLILKGPKEIEVRHMSDGLEDGIFAHYKKIHTEWHLIKAGKYKQSKLMEVLTFDWKKQGIDSNSYNYGLTKIYTRRTDYELGNVQFFSRTISFKPNKFKIKDNYEFSRGKKSVKVRYKVESINKMWENSTLSEIDKRFPSVLNSNQNPFSHIRFDGYYYRLTFPDYKDSLNVMSQFIKFYPDGKLKYVRKTKGMNHVIDWNSITEKSDYSLKGNTANFKILNTEISFTNGTFYETFLHIYDQYYKGGLKYSEVFDFIKE